MATVGELEIRELGLRYQIQDRIRLLFYLVLAITIIVIAAIISGSGGQGILAGGLIGLFAHWRMTSTCQMTLHRRTMLEQADTILVNHRYKKFGGRDDRYRLTLPRFLYFNQQDVLIKIIGDEPSLIGPRNVLSMIGRRISIGD